MLYRFYLPGFVLFPAVSWYYIPVVMQMEVNCELIGRRIRQRRKEKHLTQEDLAERIGLSKNHVSNMERGKYLPTTQTFLRLCDVLGETPDYYLMGKISADTDQISALVRQLPEQSQRILCKLVETYLKESSGE